MLRLSTGPRHAGQQIFLFVFPESCIYFFLWLQRVPLGDGPPGVGQHVGPVPQLVARGPAAQEEFADGLVLGHSVVVPDGDDNIHVLVGTGDRASVGPAPAQGAAQSWALQGNPPESD